MLSPPLVCSILDLEVCVLKVSVASLSSVHCLPILILYIEGENRRNLCPKSPAIGDFHQLNLSSTLVAIRNFRTRGSATRTFLVRKVAYSAALNRLEKTRRGGLKQRLLNLLATEALLLKPSVKWQIHKRVYAVPSTFPTP